LLGYARKVLGWEELLDAVKDRRKEPRIPARTIVRSAAVMFLSRLGSLNALEQTRSSRFWEKWLGHTLPSADTVGRVCALTDEAELRALLHHLYSRFKRMKALAPPAHGLIAALVDGHESHATFRRHCPGCLERVIHTQHGDRTQYYHRHVTLQLVGRDFYMALDVEPQRPGEDEVATALRLLERVLKGYPRAFDVIVADALYADSRWFNYALEHGKDAIAVLKDERRDLLNDARLLFEQMSPRSMKNQYGECRYWDAEGFTSWSTVVKPVRVVRSAEQRTVRRQLDQKVEELHSEWMWVTTLSSARASAYAVAGLGHSRWTIENQGFNELVNRWHADHVYKHEPQAMLVFWLLAIACLNVFLAFYVRNLKPAVRRAVSMLHVARQVMGELYAQVSSPLSRAPPCCS
jgi:DDE family transposase